MHYEILVEDLSGNRFLEIILDKILGNKPNKHTWNIHSYCGCGNIPSDLKPNTDPSKRILLDRLPSLLNGYGNMHQNNTTKVVIVVDLDRRDEQKFKGELNHVLNNCKKKPNAVFCVAIEEMEAWLLGDKNAIIKAYPKAKLNKYSKYKQDSICGTWEFLADIIHPGGAKKLKTLSYRETGILKSEWAINITPKMNIKSNCSPSFNDFIKNFE